LARRILGARGGLGARREADIGQHILGRPRVAAGEIPFLQIMKTEVLPADQKLALTNSEHLEMFWIGVGSAAAKKHAQSNFLIIKGDAHVLVDFGAVGPLALLQNARLRPTDIRALLPTHSHADHIGGIEELFLSWRYGAKKEKRGEVKPTCIINEHYQEVLWDRSLRGGLEWNEEGGRGQLLAFTDYCDVLRPTWKTQQPREIWEIDFQGIRLELFRTKHVPETAASWQSSFVSYGLMIDDRILVSGDTRFDPDLLDLYADRAEVIFHDVQFFSGAVHTPLADLKTLPTKWKQKMHLYHYADNYEEQDIREFAGWTRQGLRYLFDRR
jgi:ribonuclease BN (tRNA processing enzyme)